MHDMKFITARFSDNARTIVESTWEDETGDLVLIHIEAKEDNDYWKELLTHITIDQLHENTYKFIKERYNEFEIVALEIAKKRGLVYDINTDKTAALKMMSILLFSQLDENELKEYLFVYKLNLFENEVIKNSKDRTGKAAIRKATNIVEATMAACELYQKESRNEIVTPPT